MVRRKNRWKTLEGSDIVSTPNQMFNYESVYKRFEAGRLLYSGDNKVWSKAEVEDLSQGHMVTVPSWKFTRKEERPGEYNKTGYWEVRYATPEEAFVHLRGELPKYHCDCPDHSLRLEPAPLNDQIKRKFPKSWSGLLRDCKHIWAVRYLNDEIKLVNPLPNDVLLPDDTWKPDYEINPINRNDGVQSFKQIQGINRFK